MARIIQEVSSRRKAALNLGKELTMAGIFILNEKTQATPCSEIWQEGPKKLPCSILDIIVICFGENIISMGGDFEF